ncbi:RimJ/RimL family protein N-acetyltransferase [Clostridium acetobutylicum]|uniref:Predicted acetyltransferase n=1 Tax=Clostridium acetobutylicum (strain ATCC 824 / DSM 792 / JCM 1419 / IAM 19013 / LMG 5710 / NBRC 13948 / NRRL B-527 / VKM B-1787 / 2291 / W) TaxID=272562 RepID=Q97G03_CLOAB|nr:MULTISPECIES: GNAT family N-acetyltransferase [Clostridium]AAK80520.1 Predicted acetyltransferase [Clostridium acetobutylicum ATCC 824]ADZ21619.1 acetyltransferase [Clostridium acetobutylicum EA 2018]AEI34350.1 acetyltransferase [Clostridium acetobutylicum DSM 1731]AWV79062.1 GNAT family N-acetyltransferase [Clostridium acetobutylicum]MBC2394977.1 GNAT family N-acetyltransferase [Clostridium acetobutylicum]
MQSESLVIRRAEEGDAYQIIRLVKQVIKESPFFERTPEEFNFTVEDEQEYIKNTELFIVVEVDGKIVGSATLKRSSLSMLRHTALFGITILKEYSGKGIGSLIIKRVFEWAEENAIEKIDLEVFHDNFKAISLYKKFGFIEEGRKKNAIKAEDGYKDLVLMGRFSKA